MARSWPESPPSPVLEGAARLFSGPAAALQWNPPGSLDEDWISPTGLVIAHRRRRRAEGLPDGLRESLLRQGMQTDDESRLERAQTAFGPAKTEGAADTP